MFWTWMLNNFLGILILVWTVYSFYRLNEFNKENNKESKKIQYSYDKKTILLEKQIPATEKLIRQTQTISDLVFDIWWQSGQNDFESIDLNVLDPVFEALSSNIRSSERFIETIKGIMPEGKKSNLDDLVKYYSITRSVILHCFHLIESKSKQEFIDFKPKFNKITNDYHSFNRKLVNLLSFNFDDITTN